MKKSSANPVEIKTLDKVHVLECGMGIAHSIFIARNESEADQKAIDSYAILDQSDLDWKFVIKAGLVISQYVLTAPKPVAPEIYYSTQGYG